MLITADWTHDELPKVNAKVARLGDGGAWQSATGIDVKSGPWQHGSIHSVNAEARRVAIKAHTGKEPTDDAPPVLSTLDVATAVKP